MLRAKLKLASVSWSYSKHNTGVFLETQCRYCYCVDLQHTFIQGVTDLQLLIDILTFLLTHLFTYCNNVLLTVIVCVFIAPIHTWRG